MNRPWIKFAVLAAGVAVVLALFWRSGIKPLDLPPDLLKSVIVGPGVNLPLAFLCVYLALSLAAFPTSVLNATGGLLFGWPVGFVWVTLAVNLAGNLLYWISRALGREFVERIVRGPVRALDRAIGKHAFGTALTMRLVPVIPFNASSYACGVSEMPWRPYALATFLGMIPRGFAYSYLGGHLDPRTKEFWIGVGSLAILPLLAYVYGRIRKGKTT